MVHHRDDLVADRTRVINRRRWHLHELNPALQLPARTLHRRKNVQLIQTFLEQCTAPGTAVVVRLAGDLLRRCVQLTQDIKAMEKDIEAHINRRAPTLLTIVGCAQLTAAKIIGETAGVDRFRSKDAYARYNGTAPLPAWSSNRPRHRLSRIGNRQLNAALHRIAITQTHYHPAARQLLERRQTAGDNTAESLRVLKRQLSDVAFQALREDLHLLAAGNMNELHAVA